MMIYEGVELIDFLFKASAITLLAGITAILFAPGKIKPIITVVTVLFISVFTGLSAVKCLTAGMFEIIINGGRFLGEVPLRVDALSAWFILIINITASTGVLYGAGYLNKPGIIKQKITFHWILYLLFHSSMILVSLVQHSIAFIIAWEIMSLSSLFLVLYDNENPEVLKAGINYLVQMHLSVVFLTTAFIWAYFKTGTFDFNGLNQFFISGNNIWLFLIFFAGFGIKAGFLGFHSWLPKAHPAAPSHISGVMSGVIVKMGIYGILRIITYLRNDYILLGEIILTVSLLTGIFGIMNAAVHRDFKKMLAYCTIENIGIIGIGIGLGMIGLGMSRPLISFFGFGGALLHVMNHSLFKSLLFFSAGSVYRQTHTKNMNLLGGILKKMPQTGLIFLFGAIAIGGIPPLNGFISEFLIYCGIIEGIHSLSISGITLMIITFAGLSLIGGISIVTFTKSFSVIFLGNSRNNQKAEPVEVSFLMLLPQYIIILLMLMISFFPSLFMNIAGIVINNGLSAGLGTDAPEIQKYLLILKKISFASLIFICITAVALILRALFTREEYIQYSSTWGCGYTGPTCKMQYTGKSYSKSISKIFNFVLIEKKNFKEIDKEEYFPAGRKYKSSYLDIIESKIIDPLILITTKFINLFQFIQNGKIQAYVIYGIIFILVIFLGTILNIWH